MADESGADADGVGQLGFAAKIGFAPNILSDVTGNDRADGAYALSSRNGLFGLNYSLRAAISGDKSVAVSVPIQVPYSWLSGRV